jgi:DNA processing protein
MSRGPEYSTTARVLALCRYGGVNPRLFDVLLAAFGDLEKILQADQGSLASLDGMTMEAAGRIIKGARSLEDAAAFERDLAAREIQMVTRFDAAYPNLLFELNDPPPLLYHRGRMPDAKARTVALVGTEKASNSGIELTTSLARTFAENRVQLVASLRTGIDAAAHLGCRAAEGVSFAVVEAGFDTLAESESLPLAIDIAQQGGVISEYPPDEVASPARRKEANRLIVGLADAVVVTELYRGSERTLDILSFCRMIGKLAFIVIDPNLGALADETSLAEAVDCGAIPIKGPDRADDIIRSLV